MSIGRSGPALPRRTAGDASWCANQRISVDEALRVYTRNGAYNAHEEQLKGSIAAGKLADYVVLSDDPHKVAADKIKDIEIVRTVTGGRVTHAT
jgi:predicted amidohydrolase YtcJ